MNCYLHTDTPAIAFCRSCGRGLCSVCRHFANQTVYCAEHVPVAQTPPVADSAQNPYIQHGLPPMQTSPGLAFLLGLIPGVGAIYNGQYFKGFIHVAILGVLISILSSGHFHNSGMEALVGLLIGVWFFYMPFEAYHTARKRQSGVEPDEWSSVLPLGVQTGANRRPIGPIILITVGAIFLLENLGILYLGELLRFWPLILIAIGIYLLYNRLSTPADVPPGPRDANPPAGSPNIMGATHEQ